MIYDTTLISSTLLKEAEEQLTHHLNDLPPRASESLDGLPALPKTFTRQLISKTITQRLPKRTRLNRHRDRFGLTQKKLTFQKEQRMTLSTMLRWDHLAIIL